MAWAIRAAQGSFAWLLMPTALSKMLVWIQCLSVPSAAREKSAAAAEPGKGRRRGIANVTELPPRGYK